jgi:cell division septum initiation protein DivIVA
MASSIEPLDAPQFSTALRGYHRAAVRDRIDQLVDDRAALARRAAELEDEIATMQQAIDRHRQAPAFAVVLRRFAEVLGSAYDDADRIRLDSKLAARAERERADRVVATHLTGVAALNEAGTELTRIECAALVAAADRDAEQIRAAATRATNGATAAADTIVRVTEEEAHARTKEVLGALLIQRKAADAAARENLPVPGRRRPGLLPTPAPTAVH